MRFLFFFCLLPSLIFAALPPEIELEANTIEYEKNRQKLIAKDNVVLTYKAYTVTSNLFIFDTDSATVRFPNTLRLNNDDHDILTEDLMYNFDSLQGQSSSLNARIGPLAISSRDLLFSPNKITLNHAFFTSCSSDHPHYSMTSDSIDVYPQLGFFVARKNKFHFDYLPFDIPIPYYVYGSKGLSLLGASSVLPEFGKNQLEGHFVRYKHRYIASKKLSGTADIGFSEHLYWLYGGSNVFEWSPKFHLGTTYHIYPKDSLVSAYFISKYTLSFPTISVEDENFLNTIVRPFKSNLDVPSAEFSFILQQHVLQDDYWVSHYPLFKLALHNVDMSLFNLTSDTGYSETTERNVDFSSYYSKHGFLNMSFLKQVSLSKKTRASFNLDSSFNIYSNNIHWVRLFGISSLSFQSLFNPTLSYLKELHLSGSSPFAHQRNYTYLSDEIGLSLSEKFRRLSLKSDAYYVVKTQDFRELDLSLDLIFHCWGLGFTWQTQRNGFHFHFNLL